MGGLPEIRGLTLPRLIIGPTLHTPELMLLPKLNKKTSPLVRNPRTESVLMIGLLDEILAFSHHV